MEPDNKGLLVMGNKHPIATFFDAIGIVGASGELLIYPRAGSDAPLMIIATGVWQYARACTRVDVETKAVPP